MVSGEQRKLAAETMDALLFDCDGVLAETERDGHRVAFNRAFAELGIDAHWSMARYGELLAVAGGKERLRRHLTEVGWPDGWSDPDRLVADLHRRKTKLFQDMVRQGEMPLRAGVARLIDAAIDTGMPVAVCSTANAAGVRALLEAGLGPERARGIAVYAGDLVTAKKPDPAVYRLAVAELGVRADLTVAVEDSRNGLRAAKGAGLPCIVTPSYYTAQETFPEADLLVPDLGDSPAATVTLADCRALCASA
jgi:HAD superfamily hydrolase (TIGR01509 family)